MVRGERRKGEPFRSSWREFLSERWRKNLDPIWVQEFNEYIRTSTLQIIKIASLSIAILDLVVWPADFLIFPMWEPEFKAMFSLRIGIFLLAFSTYLSVRYLRIAQRHPIAWGSGAVLIGMVMAGLCFGKFISVHSPVFYQVYPIPMLTVLLIVPLVWRIVITFGVTYSFIVTYLLFHPEHLSVYQIGPPVFWLLTSITGSVVIGHVVYVLLLRDFVSRKWVDMAAQEMESRVKHQAEILRRLTRNLTHLQETERRRIARDIHDEFGQILASLRMELEHLELILQTGDAYTTGVAEAFERVGELFDSMHRAMRSVISVLMPEALDSLGFAGAIEVMAKNFVRTHGIEVACMGLPEEMDGEVSIVLYRIIQEALTNVAKHAEASHVAIEMDSTDSEYRLRIRDDGKGFDLSLREGTGIGLLGIKERARQLGGRAEIHSQPGMGTEVIVWIPKEEIPG